jgi:RNA polymerase sigma-70 factor (ECF subfamily)
MEADDKLLVQQCLKGHKKAFETIVDKYQKVVYNLGYRLSGNFDDAEDIAQCTFIKAFERLESYNPKYKFFSWLYRIAVNESLNLIKSKKRTKTLEAPQTTGEKNPEQHYLEIELSDKIQSALMQLDPQHRLLILLKHFQYFSYKDISESLDIPEKTVKSRLYTARQLLKDELMKKGGLQ